MVEYLKSLTVFPNLSPILFCAIFYHKIACLLPIKHGQKIVISINKCMYFDGSYHREVETARLMVVRYLQFLTLHVPLLKRTGTLLLYNTLKDFKDLTDE